MGIDTPGVQSDNQPGDRSNIGVVSSRPGYPSTGLGTPYIQPWWENPANYITPYDPAKSEPNYVPYDPNATVQPKPNNVSWWNDAWITTTNPATGKPYGGTQNAKFAVGGGFEARGGDVAALQRLDEAFLANGAYIINAIDPATGLAGIPDQNAFWNLAMNYEEQAHELGLLGTEIPDYLNANLLKLQGNAVAQGFQLNNFAGNILEDNDPRSDKYFDDAQVIINPSTGLIFNMDGMTPQDFYNNLPRGGTGGSGGPVYSRPDEDVIRDVVRNHFRATVGDVDEQYVEQFKDIYMTKHRANWDNKSQDIDPMQAVMEATRKLEGYKSLHQFRPADIDEFNWVPQIINAQRQQGIGSEEGRVRGLDLATQGVQFSDAEVFQTQQRGRSQSFLQRVGNAQQSLGGIIR